MTDQPHVGLGPLVDEIVGDLLAKGGCTCRPYMQGFVLPETSHPYTLRNEDGTEEEVVLTSSGDGARLVHEDHCAMSPKADDPRPEGFLDPQSHPRRPW